HQSQGLRALYDSPRQLLRGPGAACTAGGVPHVFVQYVWSFCVVWSTDSAITYVTSSRSSKLRARIFHTWNLTMLFATSPHVCRPVLNSMYFPSLSTLFRSNYCITCRYW
ncbi:unnamed protein product, partial [Ectocarpus sp. 12 AP-2014]